LLSRGDCALVRCPTCQSGVTFRGADREGYLWSGELRCTKCSFKGRIKDGLPDLHDEKSVTGPDRWMRLGYNYFSLQHDLSVRWFLPLMQDWITESKMREAYLQHLGLERLTSRPDGRPIRILDVGMGTGSNLPLIRERIPKGVRVELWGCDLSEGMLRRGMRKLSSAKITGTDSLPTRMVIADAHFLPFASGMFDRVIHTGGIGAFASPQRALREMARVARPSSEVVVVDEALDESKKHNLLHLSFFWSITALDAHPHPPREGIPFGSTIIADTQITRFYYCLAFRTPPEPRPRA
jgi:ubiquinone/menaquinone biosynthesis C-methylase UbiE